MCLFMLLTIQSITEMVLHLVYYACILVIYNVMLIFNVWHTHFWL